jgi:hypothetical protein
VHVLQARKEVLVRQQLEPHLVGGLVERRDALQRQSYPINGRERWERARSGSEFDQLLKQPGVRRPLILSRPGAIERPGLDNLSGVAGHEDCDLSAIREREQSID